MHNQRRLNLRLDAATHARFTAATARLTTNRSEIVRALLNAAADYIERIGTWWPPRIEPAHAPEEVARPAPYPTMAEQPQRPAPRVAEPTTRPPAHSATSRRT